MQENIGMEHQRKWSSYYSDTLSISVKVPIGWEIGSNDDFELLLLAPPTDGFKVNVGFSQIEFAGGQEEFVNAIQQYKDQLQAEYSGYKMEREEECWIDGYPAFHHIYSWFSSDLKRKIVQSLTLLFDTESRMYQINGTSLDSLGEKVIEELEEIIGSCRIIR